MLSSFLPLPFVLLKETARSQASEHLEAQLHRMALEVSSGEGDMLPQIHPQPLRWSFLSLHQLNHGHRLKEPWPTIRRPLSVPSPIPPFPFPYASHHSPYAPTLTDAYLFATGNRSIFCGINRAEQQASPLELLAAQGTPHICMFATPSTGAGLQHHYQSPLGLGPKCVQDQDLGNIRINISESDTHNWLYCNPLFSENAHYMVGITAYLNIILLGVNYNYLLLDWLDASSKSISNSFCK